MKKAFKKITSVVLAFIMTLGICTVAFAADEIPEGCIPVYTAEDFNNIRNNLSGKYILMNDIDLSVYENWVPIGTNDEPFTGEIDGNGYCIENLMIYIDISEPATYYYGLFGYIKNAKINNIFATDSNFEVIYSGAETARCYLGIIAGGGYMSEITNCAVSGKLTIGGGFFTTVLGGILGRSDLLCTLKNCSNYSAVNAKVSSLTKYVYAGGISGIAMGNETECCNFGKINVEGEEITPACEVKLGGIDGKGEGSRINNCYNRGDVSIDFSTDNTFIGGVSGTSFITKNAYNLGEVILPDNFIGYSGTISGSIGIGGLSTPVVGKPSPYIENVYYLTSDLIVGYAECFHPDDYYEEDFESTYKSFEELSDEQMRNQTSFVGFDFENIWEMEENGYPVLKNQPKVTVKESIELGVGEAYLAEPGKKYYTTNEDVAKTDVNGKIVAVGVGTAVITVEYSTNYAKEITVNVTTNDENNTPSKLDIVEFLNNLWIVKVIKQLIMLAKGVLENICTFIGF